MGTHRQATPLFSPKATWKEWEVKAEGLTHPPQLVPSLPPCSFAETPGASPVWAGHTHVEGPQPPKLTHQVDLPLLRPLQDQAALPEAFCLLPGEGTSFLIGSGMASCALWVPLSFSNAGLLIGELAAVILVPQIDAPPMLLCCCHWRSQEQGPRVPVALPSWGGRGKGGARPKVLGSSWGRERAGRL